MTVLQNFIRQMSTLAPGIKHVTVIGGGLMGSGICQVSAVSGYNVSLIEVNENLVKKAKEGIKKSLERVARKKFKEDQKAQENFVTQTINKIQTSTDLESTVTKTDLVIEAIIENIKIKHKVFSLIDKVAPKETIITSNTSSLSIEEIFSVTNRQENTGGLHFFNPVPVMKLLEVIKANKTSDETYNKLMKFGETLGKVCITCKDTPGFVVNRLLVPYIAEAVRMYEREDASAKDIDIAMKLGAGYPMGPLELADYVGLDTTCHILQGWHELYPDNPLFKPIPTLNKLVECKKLGVKSGEGFYTYNK